MTTPPPGGPPPPPPPSDGPPEGGPPPGPEAEPTQPGPRERAAVRRVGSGQILGALFFVVMVVFILENTRTVRVRLIGPEVKAPLALSLLIAAVLGALIAWLLRYRRQRRRRDLLQRR